MNRTYTILVMGKEFILIEEFLGEHLVLFFSTDIESLSYKNSDIIEIYKIQVQGDILVVGYRLNND